MVFMDNANTRIINTSNVFDSFYLDSKGLYMYYFKNIPCITFVNYIDGEKSFEAVKEKYGSLIQLVHRYRKVEREKKTQFDETIMVLSNGCVLEFDSGYCEILHDHSMEGFADELALLMRPFKERQRRQPREINLIVRGRSGLELTSMAIKRVNLDLDLFYEDGFRQVDEVIRKRLGRRKDKGIVLLHGLPGTGKTTYLRYLVSKIKKRVMFLSPDIAGSLVDPEFVQLLINNPDTVLIIEDAENIIMDRRANANSSVSNLLNISDGLLADFLNVQLICTFNNALAMVDNALLRKGRLIAKYEFGKLGVEKAQKLSRRLGFDTIINKPMTVAEIANPHEKDYQAGKGEVIGFRREVLVN